MPKLTLSPVPPGKRCSACGIPKPHDAFSKCEHTRDGLQSWCDECHNVRTRALNYPPRSSGTKRCPACGEERPVDAFQKNKGNTDGLASWCRDCKNAQLRERDNPRRTEGGKRCSKCGETKPVAEFASHKKNLDGLYYHCRICQRWWQREHLYGLARATFHGLLWAQGNACAICSTRTPKSRTTNPDGWHVDHNHQTGVVRGILCSKCNTLLGHADDLPQRLESAAMYLRRAGPEG